MLKVKRVCKVHQKVRDCNLVPCGVITVKNKEGKIIDYCPMCKDEGTNYGFKTGIFSTD